MERILTKEEIAELLSAVNSGEIETETNTALYDSDQEVQNLDLVRASLGQGRWQNANFDIILESFARNYGISLTNRLERSVSIKHSVVESIAFDPLLAQVNEKGAIGILRIDPLSHAGLLIFDPVFSYCLVEVMLGGSIGMEPLLPDRQLTTIEVNIVKGVMESVCADLQKAFISLEKLTTSLLRIESDPRMINFVPPETEMMLIKFDVRIDDVAGSMNLAIPYTSLEPLREKIKDGQFNLPTKSASWQGSIEKTLSGMEVELAAQLGILTLPIKDILDLQVGDIIDLDYNPDAPLNIMVEKKPKYHGQAGMHNGKKSIHITSKYLEGDHNGN